MASLTKGKTFKAEFIRAGTVRYEDETILIREENLDNIAKNFEGAPVIIGHEDITSDNISNIKTGICGKVSVGSQVGFRAIDLIIDDDEGLQAINGGMTVSCSLLPTETREGGTYNNVPYDREVINAEGLHMALVTEPRYEEAIIYNNSKTSDNKEGVKDDNLIKAAMFKIFNNSKKSDMDLEKTNILVNGESFKASDILENSKDGLVLKSDILSNSKKEKEEEEKKNEDMKEEKKDEKKNEKEEEKEDKEEEKENKSDSYKLSNGEEKTSKELIAMANELIKMKEKKEEKEEKKEKNNSKLPLKEALDNSIASFNAEDKASSYISSKKSADLGSELF